jgi:hypothetical protein
MDGLKLLAQVALVWLIAGCFGTVAAEPEEPAPGNTEEEVRDSDFRPGADDFDTDETLDLDTDSTIDAGEEKSGWQLGGDFRPIADYQETDSRDGGSITDKVLGARLRIGADLGVTPRLHLGARLAGACFTSTDGDGCNPDFIVQLDAPTSSGLDNGQITFDELYLHLHKHERSDVAVGRLQTRFVLRAGVFARSLDRNDSSNVNVTWTDGLHAVYRARNGWRSNFVVQRNASDGSGSIRRDPLEFASSRARNTWFIGFENEQPWGNFVQRGFDVSYLPDSLLKDGVANGRREDYWGIVGRVVARWPRKYSGMHLRIGAEAGYAPVTPTAQAVNLESDVQDFAWDVSASLMDIWPGHHFGVQYARTGAGWLLSPQYRPNEEMLEFRYQWRPPRQPVIDMRIRWREDIRQLSDAAHKRRVTDVFLRATWQFTSYDR